MPLIINELDRRELAFPVLVGGAAINPRFGKRILLTEAGHYYEPGVFYCKDAFEGLATMDALMNAEKRSQLIENARQAADYELGRELKPRRRPKVRGARSVLPLEELPTAPHWGPRVVKNMPLAMVGEHLSINELYRLSWGAKNAHGEEWEALKAEYAARLARMRKEAEEEGWLDPHSAIRYDRPICLGEGLPEAVDFLIHNCLSVFHKLFNPAGTNVEVFRLRMMDDNCRGGLLRHKLAGGCQAHPQG